MIFRRLIPATATQKLDSREFQLIFIVWLLNLTNGGIYILYLY